MAKNTDKRTDVWSRDFIVWKIDSGLDCEIKGSEPIMSNFLKVFMDKKLIQLFFGNILGSTLKSCIDKGKQKSKKFWKVFFMGEKPVF